MTVAGWTAAILTALAAGAALFILAADRKIGARDAALATTSQRLETDFGTVEYAHRGNGPPLLLVHGAGGGFDQALLLADALGIAERRLIAVSRFGYLGSSLPDDSSTAAQAAAFAALLDHLGVRRTDILAMSGGVPPALSFAEAFGDRTWRLVLLSSAPFTPLAPEIEGRPVPTWVYTALLGSDRVYWGLTRVARGFLADAFDARADLRAGISDAEADFVDALIDGFLPASQRLAGLGNESAALDPDASYDLETIAAPALVVHAADDRLNPVLVGETIAARLPGAEFIRLDSGGHLLLGHHAALASRIARFLGGAP